MTNAPQQGRSAPRLRFEPFAGTLDDWGKVLETFPDREVFQTPAWMRFLAESQNAEPVVAVLKDGNSTVGYFAGMTVRKFGLKILGSPFIGWTTERMGIRLSEGVPKRPAVEALVRYAMNDLRCVHLQLADLQFTPADVEGLGFEHRSAKGFVVDLAPDEDQILQNMQAKSARYSIRKAAKLGVKIEEALDEDFADEYHAQLCDVFAKQSLVPTYGRTRGLLLMRHLLPTGNLLLLRARAPDGRCIATGIFLGMNRRAYFWGNASWRQDQHFCPNEALHWYAMRYWKNRGMLCYDLCGASQYKVKYGCTPTENHFLWTSKFRWVGAAEPGGKSLLLQTESHRPFPRQTSFAAGVTAPGGSSMKASITWPEGKRFAFTVFDDTDWGTLANVGPVYAFLADCGFRTTRSCWLFRGDPNRGKNPGQTVDDDDYRNWLLDLQAKGFEIGWHGATWHSSERERTAAALARFAEVFGHDPAAGANHTGQEEGMYWGSKRVTGWRRLIYNVLTGYRNHNKYFGDVEGSPYFWGDLCKQRIKYFRNFIFKDINTLKACPLMPYVNPPKPYVNYMFASSDGNEIGAFNRCLRESDQDRLEVEGGACIMYTHFAKGFCPEGKLDRRFQELMARLARKNGWFVPTGTLLNYLLAQRGPLTCSDRERRRLERRWLWEKLFTGTT